jgi:hypothetical protein
MSFLSLQFILTKHSVLIIVINTNTDNIYCTLTIDKLKKTSNIDSASFLNSCDKLINEANHYQDVMDKPYIIHPTLIWINNAT